MVFTDDEAGAEVWERLLHSRSSVELALVLHLVRSMPFREPFAINRALLGRRLGVSRESVSAAVTALVGYGVLCLEADDPTHFYVNPDVAHRGDGSDHRWVSSRSCCGRSPS